MAQSAGLPALNETPKVYIPNAAVMKVDALNLPSEFIAVNCKSNASEKDWSTEKWEKLVNWIGDYSGMQVVEIGLTPLITGTFSVKNLCGELSILESAEVIRRAKLFIGVDSGPAHLANAVGTPGIVLIGSYLGFEQYIPFSGFYGNGTGAEIIHARGPTAVIPAERVFEAVRKITESKSIITTHAV
jgi:heptosyltransferase-3